MPLFDVDDLYLKRFLRASLLWSQLPVDHPSIHPFLGVHARPSGTPSIVMPWLQRDTIMQFLRTVDPGSHRRRLLFEVAEGVAYLHENGFIHGDICGSNVLIDDDMHTRLAGFALLDVESTNMFDKAEITVITQAREVTESDGDIRWMAPERFSGAPSRTFATDVFSFGRLCLEVITMKIPYFHLEQPRVMIEIVEGTPPPRPSAHDGQETLIPDEWWILMLRCWETDPSASPTMKDIAGTLKGDSFKVEL
ncbi:hypothetical protein JAAARDRAFT_31144 [Jaapia argillacea MUCL 33604]|uniref:Protein kinase domain-containing protein n=1 Tax=Jaapia argillacea MUCL 33604 TaxID=933084 RepID=A0A067Q668_9AGAM|nr:hypothetical protein JAAARDRAFT_31144 [Jaapia argillacea MUCL 33604]